MSNEELVKEIQSGQNREDNLTRLWESNQGLIRLVVKKFAAAGEWEDLQQEGYLALHRAVFAYDPARGASFSTVLYKWLYQGLSRYADGNTAVQLSADARQAVRAYQKMESSFLMEYGRYPTNWEAAQLLGETPDQVEKVKQWRTCLQVQSLDCPVEQEDGETSLYDCAEAPQSAVEDAEMEIYQEELAAALWSTVDSLEEEQAQVIRRKYQGGESLREIDEESGMPAGWARKAEAKGLRELGRGRRKMRLLPFYEDIRSAGMEGTGVRRFKTTWTSATERVALQNCSASR